MDVLTAIFLSLDFTVCCVCAQHITSLFHLQVSRSKRVTAKNCLIPVWTRNPKILDSEPNTIVKWDFGGPSEGESIFCTYFCFVCSVAKLCPTLCDLMDSSMPGFPDLHHLLEFAQTCPLSWWCHPTIASSVACFSSCPQFSPASGSLQWVGSSHQDSYIIKLQSWKKFSGNIVCHDSTVKRCKFTRLTERSLLWFKFELQAAAFL